MYRSPGSASSPDLATLLRRSKQKQQESPLPPLPLDGTDQSGARLRTTSTTPTSASLSASQGMRYKTERFIKPTDPGSNSRSPDWAQTSPRGAQENKSPKRSSRASVKAKTSALFGRIMGQTTVKDKFRLGVSSPFNDPVLSNTAVPAVPPLPNNQQSFLDVFNTPPSSPKSPTFVQKGQIPRSSRESDDNSLVMIDPLQIPRDSAGFPSQMRHGKRRSMSVSEVDAKTQFSTPSRSTRPVREDPGGTGGWDSSFGGMFADLSDPDTLSSLTLRDPSHTDSCNPLSRSRSGSVPIVHSESSEPPVFKSTLTSPISTDTLTANIETAPMVKDSPFSSPLSTSSQPEAPVIPPRSSSLQTPQKSISHVRNSPLRFGPRPVVWSGSVSPGMYSANQTPSSSEDPSRHHTRHRYSGSNSEPSLIPQHNDATTSSLTTSPIIISKDLHTGDLIPARYRSSPSLIPEDESDMEAKAKTSSMRCWKEDEEFLAKDKIAEWLGRHGRINNMALGYYMENFDFSGLRLDVAFRRLCAKLYLRAETQQVDRILEAFASRYWACNLNSVLGSSSVVHSVAYSLLLLNTDLHVADLPVKMSRNQFVRNTLSAIQMQMQPNGSNSDFDGSSIRHGIDQTQRRTKRSDSITSWNSITRDGILSLTAPVPSATNGTKHTNGSSVSIQTSANDHKLSEIGGIASFDRNWENEMESLLKDMYTAIKNQQFLQPLGSSLSARTSTSSLTRHGVLLRNRSGRGPPDRLTTLKRGSIRGLQSIMGVQSGISPYSSNSSIDGRISPSPSFGTSNEMHGSSTLFLTPTLGFASNLSHTIIREAQEDDDHSVASHESGSTNISITDEELALLGAPWAKEGMLCRKQFWEMTGKKAKVRSWMDVFVVIQKGELNMFTFGDRGAGSSGIVGGGNWLENARPVGTLMLAHGLAHALPPPGYNRQRPHCMVLTLGNGGVYFFQAGTEELVNEWVSTCNYWAARKSKEPLAGGVSNMEYGWNRVIDSQERSISEESLRDVDRSDTLSIRSIRSRYGRTDTASIRSGRSPFADRLFVNEWKQPLPPSVPSMHDEETQLEALQRHVAYLNEELQQHNELREPMSTLYSPRSSNATKALSNWERKSKYLLSEIVKYQSYIDSLHNAMALRLKRRGEKALERALIGADPDEDELHWKGHRDDETVQDHGRLGMKEKTDFDAITPTVTLTRLHRREIAEAGENSDSDQ